MGKEELIEKLVAEGMLKTQSIVDAFRKIDRADFVPDEYKDEAYEDYPLPIGHGQTISQPSTVVFMLELLQARKGDRALDVGSGSGWTTALLAELVGPRGEVHGVELVPELARFGADNLGKYNFPNARITQAVAGVLGLPQEAPFDKALVSAAGEEMPQELIKQLKVGGRMIIPIQNSVWKIEKISQSDIRKEEFPGFIFVPLKTATK